MISKNVIYSNDKNVIKIEMKRKYVRYWVLSFPKVTYLILKRKQKNSLIQYISKSCNRAKSTEKKVKFVYNSNLACKQLP